MLGRMEKAKDKFLRAARTQTGEVLAVIGGIAIFGALAVFIFRFYLWLKGGIWIPIVLADIFLLTNNSIPTVEWAGIQKIIDWFLACEIEWLLFFPGVAVGVAGVTLQDT